VLESNARLNEARVQQTDTDSSW